MEVVGTGKVLDFFYLVEIFSHQFTAKIRRILLLFLFHSYFYPIVVDHRRQTS